MQVKVKLFATLRINREKELILELTGGITVKEIVEQLKISEDEAALTFVNGRSVPLDHELTENDTLSIFPPVGGG